MKIKNTLTCLFPLILISCMKVKDKAGNEVVPQAVPQQLSAHEEFSYEIIGGENPDSFTYKFSLGLPQTQLFVRRLTKESNSIEAIQTDSRGEWTDQKIPAAPEATYQFGYFQENQFSPIKTKSISRPRDLIVADKINWSQIKEHFTGDSLGRLRLEKFHRLYFKEGAVLTTEGQNLNLHVKEFFAKNAEIQTWPEGQKANLGKIGRHGGQIFITADKASGKISIKLRGENGGDGLPGKSDPSLNGSAGMPGIAHQFTAKNDSSSCFANICTTHYTCIQPATSGGQGGPGRKGFKGGTGFRGGNSGFIQFKILSSSDLVWTLDTIPGLGGEGGAGGPGGEGGPGGPAGEWQIPSPTTANLKIAGPCPKPLDSLKGTPGEFGDKGDSGALGIKEISCFSEGNQPSVCP